MAHSEQELFREIVRGAAREARFGDRPALARQGAGAGDAIPTNGYWDDDGEWREYMLLSMVGFEDGVLA